MKYNITLNGRTYEVEVEACVAMALQEFEAFAPAAPVAAAPAAPVAAPAAAAPAAPAAPAVAGGESVDAPMPGTILKVNVQVGQTVKAGDVLVILEAMKMENEIMSPRAGTVSQILVSKGSTVDTGAALIVLN